ncbi:MULTISPECIES: undecaprenyl-phosphate glucose phosphotransferase [unclassified Bradyrhizobium]|uniref:undecaprenyl-phosphate glucose phosphotransferase n=1 Tax=unclassified Bradyrhizobium TaxID=2631580 RepID=UPI001BAB29E3|nr:MULTISPECIES: undecaprenyl-phosphate glucose phosphotransferase [unclassified Bradyrhizobium]MBR1229805.1 undecaprenyl-phosphate glucose phosphotransferase [Bradyrhizobium sp. AUGA SZCCT0176]MBR1281877.1 undecaprenyl-phosphate glucose phosphotransferase [Bradyrhizobium sp. AUGA SZCCT0177]MBR1297725.1 undecaprenyl-phosphate glucose phosphotransferase [Bradyrhizobium sp. AUGA SZCCT0042]
MLDAAAATAAATATGERPPIERRRRLSPAALAVTNQKVSRAYSPIVIAGAVRLVDFVMLSLIGLALYFAYVVRLKGFHWEYVAAIVGMTATAVICFQAADIYEVQVFRGQLRQMTRMISSWAFVFLLFIGASFLVKLGSEISRIWLASFFVVGLAALLIERAFLRALVRSWARQGRLDRRTIVVGSDQNGEQLVEALKTQHDSDIDVLGVFDDRNDARALETCAGSPKLGKVDDIVEFARRTRVDLVLFALPISAETRILEMLKKLWVLPVDIRLSAHTNKLRFRPRSYSYLGEVPTLDVFEAPITDWDLVMKWLFDHVVGFLILMLALPVMGLVALAIKLDSPGPVIFRQKRFGFNNERIDVFKFRSMYHHLADPTASKVVTKNDARVTRVGRFIRKTSLDELPQLFNVVFKSNLSLVGPRPHAVQGKLQSRLFDEAVDGYFARHRVKPGITGWAQINGWRGEVDTDEKIQKRVEFDLYYIENWSVLFDLFILLRTPLALMTKNENAY